MDDIVLTFWEAVGAVTTTLGITFGTIVYLLLNLDKAESLVAKFAKIFSHFSMRAERRTIASDIQSKIRTYRKDNSVEGILKYGIKFKWVTDEQNSSYMDGDDVVVIMSHHRNNAENFLNAILQYTERAVLPDVQNYIPPKVMAPIMLVMQDKIIREQRPEAMPMFRDKIMNVAVKKNPALNPILENLRQLDRIGWLIPIYLNEIQHVGSRLYELTDKQKSSALNKFLQFLMTIVDRPPELNVPLSFKDQIFGLRIILVARLENVIFEHIDAYTSRAKQAVAKEFDSIYVAGGGFNVGFTSRVIDAIKAKDIATHVWTRKHEHKDRHGTTTILALFRNQFVQKFES